MRSDSVSVPGARRGSAIGILVSAAGGISAAAIVVGLAGAPQAPERVTNAAAADVVAIATSMFTEEQTLSMTRDEMWEHVSPAIACFAPGTDPETMAMVNAGIEGILEGNQDRFNLNNRWPFSVVGEPTTLTWSFVPDGLSINSGVGEGTSNSTLFTTLDTRFVSLGGRATWIGLFEQSFDRWAELTGLSYEFISFGGNDWDDGAAWGTDGTAGRRGDLRITMKQIDGQSNTLAYNFFPLTSRQGDMVLDSAETWNAQAPLNFRYMRNIIMHEHGHGMGINHICSSNASFLMEPFINTSFDGPQHDDLLASHRHYGDFFEPNDTSGLAVSFGALPSDGSTVTIGDTGGVSVLNSSNASIYPNNESDWFRLSLDGPVFLSVEVRPRGFTYDDSDQSFNGSCNSGQATANTDNIADLAFQIVDADGSTVLHTIDSAPIEQSEFGVDMFVPGPGDFFIRVYETGNNSAPQMYNAFLSATPAECFDDSECDDGDPCNGVEICDNGQCVDGPIVDCNNNGIDDACDISSGFSADCNSNGVPDECDIVARSIDFDSGQIAPFGFGDDTTLVIDPAPVALGPVNLVFSASGDLNDADESAFVTVNGTIFGVLGSPGNLCPATPDSTQIQISASNWNDARDSGSGVVTLQIAPTAPAVDSNECPASFGQIQVNMTSALSSTDDNANGVPDECDVDTCGIADVTTVNTNPGEPGYGSPDGQVDGGDLSYFVERWLLGDASVADVTTINTNPGDAAYGQPDGEVDGGDLSFFVEAWLAGCP